MKVKEETQRSALPLQKMAEVFDDTEEIDDDVIKPL